MLSVSVVAVQFLKNRGRILCSLYSFFLKFLAAPFFVFWNLKFDEVFLFHYTYLYWIAFLKTVQSIFFFIGGVVCWKKPIHTFIQVTPPPIIGGFWKKYRNQIRIEFQHYFIRSIFEFLKILFFFSKTVLFGDPHPTSLMIDSIVSSHWKKIHLLQCIYLYPCVVCSIVFLAKKTRMGPDWMKTRILLFILLRFRAFTW